MLASVASSSSGRATYRPAHDRKPANANMAMAKASLPQSKSSPVAAATTAVAAALAAFLARGPKTLTWSKIFSYKAKETD
jgi:hypothetical protein